MLNNDICTIKGIGEKNKRIFNSLSISTIGDMLKLYPRDYSERTVTKISALPDSGAVCVCIRALSPIKKIPTRGKVSLYKLIGTDGTGTITVTWFNQDWIIRNFNYQQFYNIYGDVSRSLYGTELTLKSLEPADRANVTDGLIPIYRLTKGLSLNMLIKYMKQCVKYADELEETLPAELRQTYGLCGISYAIKNIHFPKNAESMAFARKRLAFEELFYLQLGLRLLNGSNNRANGTKFSDAQNIAAQFCQSLPFAMTGAQLRAVEDIINDTGSGKLMNRLVQGDVGCGKTAVAAAALLIAVKNGYQAAMMAPTEILANQHYHTLTELLAPFSVKVALLTGSIKAAEKKKLYQQISEGCFDIVVGTHALIQNDVAFKKLALIVTDEQHRFGVKQRSALAEKGVAPHVLIMTATPIPRTLALVLYGDMDVTAIDEMPPGRKPVQTYCVDEAMRNRINNFMRKNLSEGRQIYIICPMVDENEEAADLKAVTSYADELQAKEFSGYTVGFVHGKLSAKAKDAVMKRFADGEINVLVSTTVVEVGVNVPNASVMVIENAERFGLSQLHQLRGRVGRGEWQSYCVMFCNGGEVAMERMKIMVQTNNGFVIAEKDLELRGPGDFFGTDQHGLPPLKAAALYSDMELVKQSGEAAGMLLVDDPQLKKDENTVVRNQLNEMYHDTVNIYS